MNRVEERESLIREILFKLYLIRVIDIWLEKIRQAKEKKNG